MAAPSPDLLFEVLRCLDLTSLEQGDTDERIRTLCDRAIRPAADPVLPSVAAVCVFPRFVPLVRECLAGSGVRTAAAAGAFPSGRASIHERAAEIVAAIGAGAQEIDTVMDHAAFLAGREHDVAETLAATRDLCGDGVVLKVILEAGALGPPARVRAAADVAIDAGADFVKSSTGKADVGATPQVARAMMQAVRDHHRYTGRRVGVKLAGGIRRPAQALEYVAMLREVLGGGWLAPETFRIGASSLLDDVVAELRA